MDSVDLPHTSSFKGGSEIFLRNVFENIVKTYLRKNPTAKTIWELVQSLDNEKISYDHFTFRTFKVDGYGIDSLSSFFMDYGYKTGGGLDFPNKKIRVIWLSPPDVHVPNDGHGLGNGPLPRVVMAEVLVDELSLESQGVIRKYLKPEGGKQAVLSSTLGSLIWEKPTWTDFKILAKESEIAAWTLIHGYTMNHLAFAVHRFKHRFSDIKCIKQYFEGKGFELNTDGGILKVSQDGLLLQVSTISEKLPVKFADGVTEIIPASYIEFTQRQILPQFKDLPHDEIKEFHRREAFKVNSANNIMESTRFTTKF
ncbi:2-oxoadipate dioxygenase/decarboxylase [Cardamine amara subsp. amara]|uniref:2-oxoadipate dioxygenase/decarboxylase n=1 Tax=Cardamine amara subsp. amara TaxID=228776 RepID=A0ABD0ZWK1_CARAN